MKRNLLIALILLCFTMGAAAQSYDNAVGIRAGYSSGLMFRHFTGQLNAADIYALYHRDGFQVAGFYTQWFSPHFRERLKYYAGAGLFGGNWESAISVGPALIAGGEFAFREIPLSLGVQWKPMLNAYKVFDIAWYDFAITACITFD